MDTNIKTTELDIEAIENKSYEATRNFDSAINEAKHAYANYVMALKDKIIKLQKELDLANSTIFTLRNKISNLQKEHDSFQPKVKAAYKDGYGTALQKVLNIVNKLDEEDAKSEIERDNVDEYLSQHKGNYVLSIKDIVKTGYLITDILSTIITNASRGEISLWINKHVMYSRSWVQLFIHIDLKTCSEFADIVNSNPKKYNFVNYQYEELN